MLFSKKGVKMNGVKDLLKIIFSLLLIYVVMFVFSYLVCFGFNFPFTWKIPLGLEAGFLLIVWCVYAIFKIKRKASKEE